MLKMAINYKSPLLIILPILQLYHLPLQLTDLLMVPLVATSLPPVVPLIRQLDSRLIPGVTPQVELRLAEQLQLILMQTQIQLPAKQYGVLYLLIQMKMSSTPIQIPRTLTLALLHQEIVTILIK